MRSEWETVRLSDVCDLVAGFAFKSKDFGSFEDKVIKITHIVPPTVAMDSLVGVNLKKYDKGKLGRYVAGVGDYVLAMTGATVGKLGRIEHGHAYINQRVLLFKNYTNVDKDFLYYVLSQRIFEQYVLNYIDSESAQANISAGTIGKFTFQMPPLGVQKKIGRLLRIIDEKCVLNKKINDNLQQQAQAIYQSLFVSFDGIPTNQLIDSELGLMPVGWTVKSLSEVTTSIRTKVKDNDYKVLSAINTGQLQLSEEHFNKQVFSKNISNYIVVEPFDFAYNPARINIGSIGMNTLGLTGCVSPVYVVIRTEPGYHHFFDFFVKTKRFSEEVKTRASGSVRQSLSYVDFGQIKVAYPPIDAVERFNREYTVRLKIMEQLKTENEKLVSIRDSLLPKLMSGEIDVSDVKL